MNAWLELGLTILVWSGIVILVVGLIVLVAMFLYEAFSDEALKKSALRKMGGRDRHE